MKVRVKKDVKLYNGIFNLSLIAGQIVEMFVYKYNLIWLQTNENCGYGTISYELLKEYFEKAEDSK